MPVARILNVFKARDIFLNANSLFPGGEINKIIWTKGFQRLLKTSNN